MKPTRVVFWLVVLLFAWVLLSRHAEVSQLLKTLAAGQWQWVLAAALLQVVYYVAYTWLYQAAFRTVEVTSQLESLLPVTFVSIFASTVAPSGGASGAAVFVDDARRRGQSSARTAAGTLLVMAANYAVILGLALIGLAYLTLRHLTQPYEWLGALALAAMVLGLTALLLFGAYRPAWLQRILAGFQRLVNRLGRLIRRPDLLSAEWFQATSAELSEASHAIRSRPRRLAATAAVAVACNLLHMLVLYSLFLAFHQPINWVALNAGYAISLMFWVVAITPNGIGVADGVMALVLHDLGVAGDASAIVAVAFRGISLWLPLILGFFLLRRLRLFKS